jgi:hypothetical protein
MNLKLQAARAAAVCILALGVLLAAAASRYGHPRRAYSTAASLASRANPSVAVEVHAATRFDVSPPLAQMAVARDEDDAAAADCDEGGCGTSPDDLDAQQYQEKIPPPAPLPTLTPAGNAVEQTAQGKRPGIPLVDSFDGLGEGFEGPQGKFNGRSPSDSSLAVGPDEIMQIVNTRVAIYSKKGKKYDTTGKVLYGPVASNEFWTGLGGACAARNNGDVVVRYDQLANRWLIVMPIFWRIPPGTYPEPHDPPQPGELATTGHPANPGEAAKPPANPQQPEMPRGPRPQRDPNAPPPKGTWGMCYAVSTGPDPLGSYYRYAFDRQLFPDYPRPAVWPDGYYVPTSTGDEVIQKHACVADRANMLAGKPATEQCVIIDGVSFLNMADIDGQALPPPGAPNIVMAAGGTQLKQIFDDDRIYYWKFHVDWQNPANTKLDGPTKIPVAPYHFLCNGQLTSCVPQPDTERRIDVQGDKLMQRLVYRRIGNRESILASHSVSSSAGAGGVRWYEFRLDKQRNPVLYQQGTYAPDKLYRFQPSIDMDRKGDIGVGYSFGGLPNYPGQRFAARRDKDPKGQFTLHETVLAEGEASQTNTLRWEDYVTTTMDPSDDCTFWYVGDYLKKGKENYSTKIGAFRMPSCKAQ